ncbi:NAD-dependent epimerase/dehydratase family protein [Flavobacteriaceae bacterium S356]|uniref:NAD-dependent epimerase/dehydratase family protein n=1 Tax=Asprobacillus argus TaxID=3076534 RepID=A0ABU3LFR9_9FLAO|nr:NAD-dependent epimerase/dehydratase family protein [Flavobacteriaceae bacterium S356]
MSRSKSRRTFIKKGVLLGVGISLLGESLYACTANKTSEKLSILILGGTSFLGPHQIAYAISKGHSVSTFTRGKTKPTIHRDVFDKVEQLIGDRENDLSALENRHWDVVIDNSGRKTDWTRKTANLLKEKSGIYLYISSTGVYFPYTSGGIKEDAKVLLNTPKGVTDDVLKMSYDYGVMKANSELEAEKAFGVDRTIVVRPTYMFGPGDLTNRFIHWPIRLSKGGNILVPGKEDDPVQYIDVRDVAEWCIRLAENKTHGTFNAVGPSEPMTMQNFVKKAASTFDVNNHLIYIDDYDFLKKNKVHYIVPWIMQDAYSYGSARVSTEKAKKNGLTYRNLKKSIKETHDWWYSDALTDEIRERFEGNPNTVLAREEEILNKWKALTKN